MEDSGGAKCSNKSIISTHEKTAAQSVLPSQSIASGRML